nr:cytochrome P450 monooxygenase CYP6TE1 [Lasioderma serricorne]
MPSIYDLLFHLLLLLLTLLTILYLYIKHQHQHWRRLSIPYLEPKFPLGNLRNPFLKDRSQVEQFADWYRALKAKGHRYGGIYLFALPNFVPVDTEVVRDVLVKEFQSFFDRGFYYNEVDPLSMHLLSLEGMKWKRLRAKLTPTFTSGKMKMMLETLIRCCDPIPALLTTSTTTNHPIDMKHIFASYTIDVIGSCAFGIQCNTLHDNNESDFRKYGELVFHDTIYRMLRALFVFNFPNVAAFFRMQVTKPEVSKFFLHLIHETVKAREATGEVRKDFMQLLLELKRLRDEGEEDGISMEELSAQAFIFFLAGFETSSTVGTFCMYELAEHQVVQDRLREEIREVLGRHGGKITYDALQEMKYMTQVIEETLRKYPPLSFLNRVCTSDYKIPGTQVTLVKGTKVLISVLGLQRDPEFFPDPEKFDPERFSEENKDKIVPYSYIPFGEGPRICIGLRFGMMQTKMGLIALLKNHKFTVNPKTQTPIVMDFSSIILAAKGGVWLDVQEVGSQ